MFSAAGHDDDDDNDDGAVETTRSDARQASRKVAREGDPCITSRLVLLKATLPSAASFTYGSDVSCPGPESLCHPHQMGGRS